ncbi:hypothetical protein [Paenibacillus sp. DMB20]|uniref:hypothetical protein n=1 Tax=Paenibacillus sp. DMB20 TaxID=1642570 RepID=UPI000A4CCED8|nr:hypothetical protein [Paenibacillus sp. DMB20]
MRQSPQSAYWYALSLLASGSMNETASLNRAVSQPYDPFWKAGRDDKDRNDLPRK